MQFILILLALLLLFFLSGVMGWVSTYHSYPLFVAGWFECSKSWFLPLFFAVHFFNVLLLIIFELWILDWPVGNSKNIWCVLFLVGSGLFH